MKATLDLPDELYHEVESLAARRGESVTALVADALASLVEDSVLPGYEKAGQKRQREKKAKDAILPGYVLVKPEDPANAARSPEERLEKWRREEAEFMKLMEGPNLDPRSAAEIIREGRR